MAAGSDVLVRLTTGTTTYHLGRLEAICGEVPAHEATTMKLDQALAMDRRLCAKCGALVDKWVGYALKVAKAKSLVHPIASGRSSSRKRQGRETADRNKEPTPRPPRQPDPSLITYVEKGDDPDTAETRDEKAST